MSGTTEFIKKWGLFFLVMFLIILIGYLFFYDSVQREVKSKSRCLREKAAASTGGAYSVYAKDTNNSNAYKVTYAMKPNDKANPKVSIECNCLPGNTVNTFTGIRYYSGGTMYDNGKKVCSCASAITSPALYTGHPQLVDFMTSGNTSFFS